MNIIELERVSKSYVQAVPVLKEVSLTVQRGAILGFLGLNGAGKTTTIRILSGLIAPDAGDVRVFGRSISPADRRYLGSMGFVLDEPLFFEWMTAGEYLAFVAAMHGLAPEVADARSAELLEFFDLEEHADDLIATYSTGMRKKVSLAAAIIHRPALVILDEPLEGIDAVSASAIKETLRMMASRGTTVFITSHVLDTVERFCTEVAILHQGSVLLHSPIGDVHTSARRILGERVFHSLEHLFVELVSDEMRRKRLTFLEEDGAHEP
jgi:ABC-2 type transport system ATP-binding protein